MQRLQVAYNDFLRILLHRPRWCNAREMFVSTYINTLQAVLRNSTHILFFYTDFGKKNMMLAVKIFSKLKE